MQDRSITVGVLDFGSHTIKLVLAEKNIRETDDGVVPHENQVRVVYFGQVLSEGAIVRGVIRNLTDTAEKVSGLIKEAEEQTGIKIKNLYVLVDSQGLQSKLYSAQIDFSKPQEIKNEHLTDLLKEVKPEEDKFSFDNPYARFYVGGTYAERPVGVRGLNLKGEFQFFQTDQFVIQNIEDVLEEKLNLDVNSFWVAPALLGEKFLTDEQKRIGSAVVDFGDQTTSVAIYKNGFLEGLRVLPMGSQQITHDLMHLQISPKEAKRLKETKGSVLLDLKEDAPLEVKSADNFSTRNDVTQYKVNQYIEARMREIVDNIKRIITQFMGKEKLSGGIIITGGGSKIAGLQTYLIQLLEVTVTYASNFSGSNSINSSLLDSTGTLAMYALLQRATDCCTEASEDIEEEDTQTEAEKEVYKKELSPQKQASLFDDEDFPDSPLDFAPEGSESETGAINGYQTESKQSAPVQENVQPKKEPAPKKRRKKSKAKKSFFDVLKRALPFDWEEIESDDERV